MCKYVLNFRKRTIPGDPPCSDLQNPKILATNDEPRAATRHQKVRWSPASFHALTRADSGLPRVSMMAHTLTRAPPALWRHDDVTSHFQLDPIPWNWPESVTRSEPPEKKKKKKKRKEKKSFDQVDPWPWPKSQNFQNGPVLLNFSSTFRFWDPFLHSKLRNCVNVQFPKVDFCTNIDQKVKIFKKDLSYLIFRVDSIFGVYFFIWESEIAQIVWFYNCWP